MTGGASGARAQELSDRLLRIGWRELQSEVSPEDDPQERVERWVREGRVSPWQAARLLVGDGPLAVGPYGLRRLIAERPGIAIYETGEGEAVGLAVIRERGIARLWRHGAARRAGLGRLEKLATDLGRSDDAGGAPEFCWVTEIELPPGAPLRPLVERLGPPPAVVRRDWEAQLRQWGEFWWDRQWFVGDWAAERMRVDAENRLTLLATGPFSVAALWDQLGRPADPRRLESAEISGALHRLREGDPDAAAAALAKIAATEAGEFARFPAGRAGGAFDFEPSGGESADSEPLRASTEAVAERSPRPAEGPSAALRGVVPLDGRRVRGTRERQKIPSRRRRAVLGVGIGMGVLGGGIWGVIRRGDPGAPVPVALRRAAAVAADSAAGERRAESGHAARAAKPNRASDGGDANGPSDASVSRMVEPPEGGEMLKSLAGPEPGGRTKDDAAGAARGGGKRESGGAEPKEGEEGLATQGSDAEHGAMREDTARAIGSVPDVRAPVAIVGGEDGGVAEPQEGAKPSVPPHDAPKGAVTLPPRDAVEGVPLARLEPNAEIVAWRVEMPDGLDVPVELGGEGAAESWGRVARQADELRFQWAEAAAAARDAQELRNGRLVFQQAGGDPRRVYLRSPVTAPLWKPALTSGDVRRRWDLGGRPELAASRLKISVAVGEGVAQNWIEGGGEMPAGRGRASWVARFEQEDAADVVIQCLIEWQTGRQLQCRLRTGVRLAAGAAWLPASMRGLTEAAARLGGARQQTELQRDLLQHRYQETRDREVRTQLRRQRDLTERRLGQLELAAARVATAQTLLETLETDTRWRLEITTRWPDERQSIFATAATDEAGGRGDAQPDDAAQAAD